jgi:hypothetical protein
LKVKRGYIVRAAKGLLGRSVDRHSPVSGPC